MTTFSGVVFHVLSHGVIHYARSGISFVNQLKRSFWLAVKEFPPVRKWFLGLTLQTKQITPCERAWKTVPENDVRNCVHFCLKPLMTLERCDLLMSFSQRCCMWSKCLSWIKISGFFGHFLAIKTKSTWQNLEFLGEKLEFFEKFAWVLNWIALVYSKEWIFFSKIP